MVSLCWEGGGAKGAFGVKFLFELKNYYKELEFKALSGSSVGGINIIPLSFGGFEYLYSMWIEIKEYGNFIYYEPLKLKYNIKNLNKLIDEVIKEQDLFQKFMKSDSLTLIVSIIKDDGPLIFTNKDIFIKDAKFKKIENEEDLKYAIFGTSAIPKIFPEVKYNGMTLLDGGVKYTLPLNFLIESSKEDKILAIIHEPLKKYKINPLYFLISPINYIVEKYTQNLTFKEIDKFENIDENIFRYRDRMIFLIYPEKRLPFALDFSSRAIEKNFIEAERVFDKIKDKLLDFLKFWNCYHFNYN